MPQFDPFRTLVRAEGARLYRDLPWRRTRDAYGIWISEVMLQQTQVPRVLDRWERWLERFPSVEKLASAPVAEVLDEWQGMGYNRRALALRQAAEIVVRDHDGVFPCEVDELKQLPGIGPATAAGIRAFAFNRAGVYLETNVRTVMLHHFFPEVPGVPDRELIPLIEATCPEGAEEQQGPDAQCRQAVAMSQSLSSAVANPESPYALPQDGDDTPRSWYYALLDYGAYLKKTIPNPSRRSSGYTRQSRFEGSRRQKRAEIVRLLLDNNKQGAQGMDEHRVRELLCSSELAAGREAVAEAEVSSILADLVKEGFCCERDGVYVIAQ